MSSVRRTKLCYSFCSLCFGCEAHRVSCEPAGRLYVRMHACMHVCSPTSTWLLVRYLYNFANQYGYHLLTITIRKHHRRNVRLHELEWIPNHVPLCALDAIQPQGSPPSRTSSIHRERYRESCLLVPFVPWNIMDFHRTHLTMSCSNHAFYPFWPFCAPFFHFLWNN